MGGLSGCESQPGEQRSDALFMVVCLLYQVFFIFTQYGRLDLPLYAIKYVPSSSSLQSLACRYVLMLVIPQEGKGYCARQTVPTKRSKCGVQPDRTLPSPSSQALSRPWLNLIRRPWISSALQPFPLPLR